MTTKTVTFQDRNLFRCEQCGQPSQDVRHVTLGRLCYACAMWSELVNWGNGNPGALYISEGRPGVPWPGTHPRITSFAGDMPGPVGSTLPATVYSWGRGGFGTRVRCVRFPGPDGHVWSAREYDGPCTGNLLRCVRKTKQTWRTT